MKSNKMVYLLMSLIVGLLAFTMSGLGFSNGLYNIIIKKPLMDHFTNFIVNLYVIV